MPESRTQRRSGEGLSRAKVIATALTLLHDKGIDAVSISGIGRELGVSGPALYRHFANLTEIIDHVVGRLYDDASEALLKAATNVPAQQRLFVLSRALRAWALENRREFQLLFNSPVEPKVWSKTNPAHVAGRRFGGLFLSAFSELQPGRTTTRTTIELDPRTTTDLKRYAQWADVDLSSNDLAYFLEAWVQIYGHVVMEALGQLSYAMTDMSSLLEVCLRRIAEDLDVPYAPP
jgi:AcrR family transcriptional regulator